jgi:hypothetical protein
MKVVRYSESLSEPGDTMFIEIDSLYRSPDAAKIGQSSAKTSSK